MYSKDLRLAIRQAEYNRQYYLLNKAKFYRRGKKNRDKDKAIVYKALGDRCACCGELEKAFLTIDHINNDGKQDRASLASRMSIHRWIINQGIPKDKYQILCWNCNMAKRWGNCPHNKTIDKKN